MAIVLPGWWNIYQYAKNGFSHSANRLRKLPGAGPTRPANSHASLVQAHQGA
jgi:hypothetical protein